jgi:importin subunit beta-1
VFAQVLAADQINMILTAVVAGMRPDEPSDDARLAATVALQNAIEFAEHNFDTEQERNYIMQVGGQVLRHGICGAYRAAAACTTNLAVGFCEQHIEGFPPVASGQLFHAMCWSLQEFRNTPAT